MTPFERGVLVGSCSSLAFVCLVRVVFLVAWKWPSEKRRRT